MIPLPLLGIFVIYHINANNVYPSKFVNHLISIASNCLLKMHGISLLDYRLPNQLNLLKRFFFHSETFFRIQTKEKETFTLN